MWPSDNSPMMNLCKDYKGFLCSALGGPLISPPPFPPPLPHPLEAWCWPYRCWGPGVFLCSPGNYGEHCGKVLVGRQGNSPPCREVCVECVRDYSWSKSPSWPLGSRRRIRSKWPSAFASWFLPGLYSSYSKQTPPTCQGKKILVLKYNQTCKTEHGVIILITRRFFYFSFSKRSICQWVPLNNQSLACLRGVMIDSGMTQSRAFLEVHPISVIWVALLDEDSGDPREPMPDENSISGSKAEQSHLWTSPVWLRWPKAESLRSLLQSMLAWFAVSSNTELRVRLQGSDAWIRS